MTNNITVLRSYFHQAVEPKSQNDDVSRREYIFNILLLSLIVLTLISFSIALFNRLTQAGYHDQAPWLLLVPTFFLLGLYICSRRRFNNYLIVVFLALFVFLGTYALYIYGYVLPEGLLTYVTVIVMSGVLLSAKAALITSGSIALCLCSLAYLQLHHLSTPDLSEQLKILSFDNVILYSVFFLIIVLVTWLANREITNSLLQARHSEYELAKERDSLERKVRDRTLELEQSHIEKIQELQRFAEFGRMTGYLLHDLSNPLTSATLELDQSKVQINRRSLSQIRKSINAIEAYVESARMQLRRESSTTTFKVADEIRRVVNFLHSKARNADVFIECLLLEAVKINGDAIRFNQIFANLIANAIDAYESTTFSKKVVCVEMVLGPRHLMIKVQDKGMGIVKDRIEQVFEPFYTTKAASKGTGIGLAIVKQTVESDFMGSISVISQPNISTSFIVKLPLDAKQ